MKFMSVLGFCALVLGFNPIVKADNTGTCVIMNVNPQFYVGECRVEVGTGEGFSLEEGCSEVVACLNNPLCVNVTYCNATTIRMGWYLDRILDETAP